MITAPTSPTALRRSPTAHETVPAASLYWAVLDASVLSCRSRTSRAEQLGYLFEHMLPLPIDEVHAIYVPRSGDRSGIVACGIARSRLDELMSDSTSRDDLAMCPDEVPDFVITSDDDAMRPGHFNLLTGPYTPRRVRRERRRAMLLIAGLFVAVAATILVGSQRRLNDVHQRTNELHAARNDVYVEALGPGTSPELRMLSELRLLRQTRNDAPPEVRVPDVAVDLAAVLESLPRELFVQLEAATVSEDLVTLRCRLESPGDVQHLADALARVAGWDVQAPTVRRHDGGVIATIQIERLIEQHVEDAP